MTSTVVDGRFDPWQRLTEYQHERGLSDGRSGATAVFVGTMRDFNDGAEVAALTLEHYPGMAERYLGSIAEQAAQRWPLNDLLIVHRVGRIVPGEAIVLVAAWSSHRAAAFAACRFLIEELKSHAPFWKRELTGQGERWVAVNTTAEEVQAGTPAADDSKEICV